MATFAHRRRRLFTTVTRGTIERQATGDARAHRLRLGGQTSGRDRRRFTAESCHSCWNSRTMSILVRCCRSMHLKHIDSALLLKIYQKLSIFSSLSLLLYSPTFLVANTQTVVYTRTGDTISSDQPSLGVNTTNWMKSNCRTSSLLL